MNLWIILFGRIAFTLPPSLTMQYNKQSIGWIHEDMPYAQKSLSVDILVPWNADVYIFKNEN